MDANEFRKGTFLKKRVDAMLEELDGIFHEAQQAYPFPKIGEIQFQVDHLVVSDEVRHRVRRFLLPFTIHKPFQPVVKKGFLDFLEFQNAFDAVATLNLWRPIIYNESDFVYYQKMHNFICQALTNDDEDKGPLVTVLRNETEDVTQNWIKLLSARRSQIQYVKRKMDFDFLYNGLLQHSDERHFSRYDELTEGRISEILIRHAFATCFIVECLNSHTLSLQFATGTQSIGFHWGP